MYKVCDYEELFLQFIKTGKDLSCSSFRNFIRYDLKIENIPSKTWFNKHFQSKINNINQIREERKKQKGIVDYNLPFEFWRTHDLVLEYFKEIKKHKQPLTQYGLWREIEQRVLNDEVKQKLDRYNNVFSRCWKYYTYNDLNDSGKYRFLWINIKSNILKKSLYNNIYDNCIHQQIHLFICFTLNQLQQYVEECGVFPQKGYIWSDEMDYVSRYYLDNLDFFYRNQLMTTQENERYCLLVALYQNKKSKGERDVIRYLRRNGWKTESEFYFDDLKDIRHLRFDVMATKEDKMLLVEYDGKQHFYATDYFGGDDSFKTLLKHDQMKNEYCLKNNIPLLRIRYDESVEEKLDQYLKTMDILCL